MADYKLTSPHLRVLRGSPDAPEVIEVQTYTPDLIMFDVTRAKRRWGTMQDEPFRWMTFLSWHACRREGRIPADLTYETWESSILDVTSADDDDDSATVDPTPPGVEPG